MNENDIIVELADRLGVAAEEIFTIFSESIRGIALLDIITLILLFIGFGFIMKYVYKTVKKVEYSNRDDITYIDFDNDDWFKCAVWTIVIGVVWVIFVLLFNIGMTNYLFSEYIAIKQMLMIVSGN